jgi:hypothetical protein
MLIVSQLSKSFAGPALFDDVSLQVNHRISSAGNPPPNEQRFSREGADVSPVTF